MVYKLRTMSSPGKRKNNIVSNDGISHNNKRSLESREECSKRRRTDASPEKDIQAIKRRNFITACGLVSYKAYNDHHLRFQMSLLPSCAEQVTCKHNDTKYVDKSIGVLPSYAEELFKMEMKTNMWHGALEVSQLCITPNLYLPASILKDIMEIILNAHAEFADYPTEYLIDKCQQVFALNLHYHPPCIVQKLRGCYIEFLISPLDQKVKSFTNRAQFGCDKGIVKYCLNRLEHEISMDSKDEPLVDKYENTPEDMKQSVVGLVWQKEKFEIYEQLDRTERIKRLFAVLESIAELLQCDLAVLHTKYTNNLGKHIMRSNKPLMAHILWPDKVSGQPTSVCGSRNDNIGSITSNCKQILKLFVYVIHLQYPEENIETMTTWLNTMCQTYYICQNNSKSDYPNIGKYCTDLAYEFYHIISGMPHDTVIKVLERIKPVYMQYLVGLLHIRRLLASEKENPIKIFTEFLEDCQWRLFPQISREIEIFKSKTCSVKDIMKHLENKCNNLNSLDVKIDNNVYRRFNPHAITEKSVLSLNHVVHTFYITLVAYLDAYSVHEIQETLDTLNKEVLSCESTDKQNLFPEFCSYNVTEHLIKYYRFIYEALKELILVLQNKKNNGLLPNIFKLFENVSLLGL